MLTETAEAVYVPTKTETTNEMQTTIGATKADVVDAMITGTAGEGDATNVEKTAATTILMYETREKAGADAVAATTAMVTSACAVEVAIRRQAAAETETKECEVQTGAHFSGTRP